MLDAADRLLALASRGADLEEIAAETAATVRTPVVILDRAMRRLASGPGDVHVDVTESSPLRAAFGQIAAEGRPASIPDLSELGSPGEAIIAPILADGDVLGYLVALGPPPLGDRASALLSLQHAATVLALTMLRERISAHLTNDVRSELLRGLLLGTADEAEHRERMRILQLDPRRTYRALIVAPERQTAGTRPAADAKMRAGSVQTVLETILAHLEGTAAGTLAVATADEVLAFPAEPGFEAPGGPTAAELARSIVQRTRALFPDVDLTAGVGGPAQAVRDFPRSYREARHAVDVSRRLGRRGQVSSFEQLGVYNLLLRVPDSDELRAFAAQILGSLVEYDRAHHSELLRTLEVQLRHYGKPQLAAQELHCHVNTVAYRLERIKAIAGIDIDDAEDRLVAALALKARELVALAYE